MKKNTARPAATRNDFISSFSYDKRLALSDIKCSIAHVEMLGRKKIIPRGESAGIVKTLKALAAEITAGLKRISPSEDIHYAIEKEVIARLGENIGGKLRTARSRNDQVATDIRLYLKSDIPELKESIRKLRRSIIKKSLADFDAVMPGYTHLQEAQPVLFSHYLSTYNEMLKRDEARFSDCLDRLNESPLGAAAFAGTSFDIDRNFTARLLGFARPMPHSVDAVSSRDFACEFISACAITMVHLSRLAEDLIIFSSSEFGFVSMPQGYSSGSSIMPQKKNPDWLELIRAKAAGVIGSLTAMLSLLKGIPLSYNRDMQEDKIHIFRASDETRASLEVMASIISGLEINRDRMSEAMRRDDYFLATELADYLVGKGIPFKTAHSIVSRVVSEASSRGVKLSELGFEQYRKMSKAFGRDIYTKCLDINRVISSKNSYGGTSPSQVKKYLSREFKMLSGK